MNQNKLFYIFVLFCLSSVFVGARNIPANEIMLASQSELVKAMRDKNVSLVESMLQEGDYDIYVSAYFIEDVKFLNLFIKHGLEPEAVLLHDKTMLMIACQNGELELAERLVAIGAHVNRKNRWGDAPLHFCVGNLNVEIARFLVENGAYIDAQNHLGRTVLSHAVRSGDSDLVELLLSSGANREILDHEKRRPLDFLVYIDEEDDHLRKEIIAAFERAEPRGAEPRGSVHENLQK